MTFINPDTQRIFCPYCHEEAGLPLPCSTTVFVEFCRRFDASHKGCKQAQEKLLQMRADS